MVGKKSRETERLHEIDVTKEVMQTSRLDGSALPSSSFVLPVSSCPFFIMSLVQETVD